MNMSYDGSGLRALPTSTPSTGGRLVHRESLLRIPLVAQMLRDPNVKLVSRAIDSTWYERGFVAEDVSGFNPAEGAIYYPARSRLATWLKNPGSSTRARNAQDRLLREVLRAVHDYLHVWCYRRIQTIVPDLAFGCHGSRIEHSDRLATCHIVTEAAATVGLDYWYLCTLNINDVVPIGSALTAGWAVGFHERNIDEYRKYFPQLAVQQPCFFEAWCDFYCSGVLQGTTMSGMSRSPILWKWLEHELRYAKRQRAYARQWLRFLLSGETWEHPSDGRPLETTPRWYRSLIHTLSLDLWALVSGKGRHCDPPQKREPWRAAPSTACDFRFTNWNALNVAQRTRALSTGMTPASYRYWCGQYISSLDSRRITATAKAGIAPLLACGDATLVDDILKHLPRLPPGSEVADLLFPN